jgi:hypothetical protein
MENEQSLDDILSETAPEIPAPAEPSLEESTGKADPPSDRVRDDKGRFAKKEDETGAVAEPAQAATAEAPPITSDQLPKEDFVALKDERRKRQELERRLQAMEQQLRQPQAKQQPPVDFWEDPQSFMDTRLNQLGETLLQQWEQRQRAQRIDAAEQAAKAKYADYDDAFAAFESAVQANPRLAVEMSQAADPAEYAYSKGKAALVLNTVGSLEAYEAQLRAKWEAEVKAAVPTPQVTLPSTTAADGSVGARTGPEWAGPTPLTQILGK